MHVLVASSEPDCRLVAERLERLGHEINHADDPADALDSVLHDQARPGLAIVDLSFGNRALRLIRVLRESADPLPVLVLAVPGQPDMARRALQLGVVDIITRPIDAEHVAGAASNAIELGRLAPSRLPPPIPEEAERVLGDSEVMKAVLATVRHVAPLDCTVLIVGEPGTGRDTVATTIHALGHGRPRPMVTIDCGDPDRERVDRELRRQLAPADHRASGGRTTASTASGTLYLQRLEHLERDLQDVLAERLASSRMPGGTTPGGLGLRAVSSATPTVVEAAADGRVRRDLLELLSTVRIELPPLRGRPQDIPLLASYYLKDACTRSGVPMKTLSRSALALLAALPWVGNARELAGLLERLAAVVPRGVILQEDVLELVDLAGSQAKVGGEETLREAKARFERDFIMRALRRNRGRMGATAQALGMGRTNLYRRIRRLGIDPKMT